VELKDQDGCTAIAPAMTRNLVAVLGEIAPGWPSIGVADCTEKDKEEVKVI